LNIGIQTSMFFTDSLLQEAILAATDPNRIVWMSGTVNNPGTPTNPDGDGNMILDNNASPGQ